ncbi:MAG: hypothetical protein H9847_09540 [Candidatus Anaerobiospirillum pullicola]|uniref:Uncharacterized protein n=1 Tax=Candidatus Anaerobiospirillum pullicola TaxID=2838451 RepID=A0A948X0D1_9GAMM|nr:hypothetical protein [Candidatus Anaerobiospirillum pullicola]
MLQHQLATVSISATAATTPEPFASDLTTAGTDANTTKTKLMRKLRNESNRLFSQLFSLCGKEQDALVTFMQCESSQMAQVIIFNFEPLLEERQLDLLHYISAHGCSKPLLLRRLCTVLRQRAFLENCSIFRSASSSDN